MGKVKEKKLQGLSDLEAHRTLRAKKAREWHHTHPRLPMPQGMERLPATLRVMEEEIAELKEVLKATQKALNGALKDLAELKAKKK